MKTVLLLRHGKSDRSANYNGDHNRPLAARGQSDARRVGHYLTATHQAPDVVLTSTALRTRHTAETAMQAGVWAAELRALPSLYLPEPQDVLTAIRSTSDDAGTVLIVCHQPATGAVISALIGGGSVQVPTAALARIELPISHWRDVEFGIGTLVMLMPPKRLPRMEES